MTPESIRSKLWREGADKYVYAVLDGAQNEQLLDVLFREGIDYECLFTGKLEPDMAEVAPYLVPLSPGSDFTTWLLDEGWGQHWGIYLTSREDLSAVWRHLRQHTRVFSPERERLYFRFYDPRVLHAFLPTCNGKQLADFFGPVDMFIAERGAGAHAYVLADDQLVTELIKAN